MQGPGRRGGGAVGECRHSVSVSMELRCCRLLEAFTFSLCAQTGALPVHSLFLCSCAPGSFLILLRREVGRRQDRGPLFSLPSASFVTCTVLSFFFKEAAPC